MPFLFHPSGAYSLQAEDQVLQLVFTLTINEVLIVSCGNAMYETPRV
jgi:hypothetical protein